MQQPHHPSCFFAYPSKPSSLSEAVENAIELINGTEVVDASSWKDLAVTGRLVIKEIFAAIDATDIFACDLTHLNPNVLFELGYAVARNKKVWIFLDSSYETTVAEYKKVNLLSSVGYAEYHNSRDIVNSFLDDQPFLSVDETLYEDIIEAVLLPPAKPPGVLYLKSAINTEASNCLTRRLEKSPMDVFTDDPDEVSLQTLAWYAENSYTARCVIAHLLDDVRSQDLLSQNAKYAFVAGLSVGFEKPTLILAHSPYIPAFDYQDLLRVHDSASDCANAIDHWIAPLEEAHRSQQEQMVEFRKTQQAANALRQIYLGDHIAENEEQDLSHYFIRTPPYNNALSAEQSMIFVGRKGTGKTANLFRLSDELARDKRNHVCIVKPVDYDLEGMVSLLRDVGPRVERSYMAQSLWKFLIYTQLAVSAKDEISSLPIHVARSAAENDFLAFTEEIELVLKGDFSSRMDSAIAELCGLDTSAPAKTQKARISEILHESILGQLRDKLGAVFQGRDRVIVLVDNLDKAWGVDSDISVLSEFLFGLLSVSRTITNEFGKQGVTWKSVALPIIVFLRSDIFSYIISAAREGDKLAFSTMDWTDTRLLQRLIEERFLASLDDSATPDLIWNGIFSASVGANPVWDHITSRIIQRPRDAIYLCKASLARAVGRRHIRIEAEDVASAEDDYSQYAYLTLVAEIRPLIPDIEYLLVHFAGSGDTASFDEIDRIIMESGIEEVTTREFIDLLSDSLFLGVETEPGVFTYLYDYNKRHITKALAQRVAEKTGTTRYSIHPAFHRYFEISPKVAK